MKEESTQRILKSWFEKKGFHTIENVKVNGENRVDLKASKNEETWIIEIKGDYDKKSAQYSVNFDTGMGQLLKSITHIDSKINYAICIPYSRTENGEKLSYRLALKKYKNSIVFEQLNIYIILVRDDESVEIIAPKEVKPFLNAINPKIKIR